MQVCLASCENRSHEEARCAHANAGSARVREADYCRCCPSARALVSRASAMMPDESGCDVCDCNVAIHLEQHSTGLQTSGLSLPYRGCCSEFHLSRWRQSFWQRVDHDRVRAPVRKHCVGSAWCSHIVFPRNTWSAPPPSSEVAPCVYAKRRRMISSRSRRTRTRRRRQKGRWGRWQGFVMKRGRDGWRRDKGKYGQG